MHILHHRGDSDCKSRQHEQWDQLTIRPSLQLACTLTACMVDTVNLTANMNICCPLHLKSRSLRSYPCQSLSPGNDLPRVPQLLLTWNFQPGIALCPRCIYDMHRLNPYRNTADHVAKGCCSKIPYWEHASLWGKELLQQDPYRNTASCGAKGCCSRISPST